MAPPLLVEDEMQAFAEAYLAADEQAAGTPAGPTPAPVTAQGRHAPSRLPSAKDPDPPPEAPAGPALGNSGERASGHHAVC